MSLFRDQNERRKSSGDELQLFNSFKKIPEAVAHILKTRPRTILATSIFNKESWIPKIIYSALYLEIELGSIEKNAVSTICKT